MIHACNKVHTHNDEHHIFEISIYYYKIQLSLL